ncbi:carboxyl-terminal processing protease [Peribacillus deserti]|uniref:Carboxyl-terminal processing protease n=1 Tax=Peribacillus deserti TaxID=673318 RepID=A0ABS2QDN0_9BACI|nr:S41 family peptidase [Peribacillus deserti]MBM7690914.1 carboxyl-terminal processing protease [Peribacillus deserti]
MGKKWVLPLSVALSLTTGAAGGVYAGIKINDGDIPGFSQKPDEKMNPVDGNSLLKVHQAYQLIKENYVEKVGETQLEEGAIQGMLSTLKDPYSVYMNRETAEQFNEALDSSFEGIGTEIGEEDGKVIIISPYKDSPAEKAGLKPRDQIIKVNGESVEGLNLYDTRLKIRGKKGTAVKLEIKRAGVSNPIEMKIVRDTIPIETVVSKVMEQRGEKIGYLAITSFSEHTSKDFRKELRQLEAKQIKGLIIDVRGNPGGLLSSVEEILGQFVTKDKPYIQIQKRNGDKKEYFTTLKKEKPYEVAVLIDKGSASASEILAGALNEAEGYKLIGERTFGKGTVQQAVPMNDGSNIKLTLYKWLTPEGNWIHKKGIEPTIEISQPSAFQSHPLNVEKPFKRDSNDEQVKHAQEMLKSLGFETGRDDGYFDKKTEVAVKAFQSHRGLKQSGVLDSKTAKALANAVLEYMKDEKHDLQLRMAMSYLTK